MSSTKKSLVNGVIMKKPQGIILYQGPSLIDEAPIVCIANGFTKVYNEKVGEMIQTWIMRSDVHPCNAMRDGSDVSICGDCKHRNTLNDQGEHNKDRSCYVNPLRGPIPVYNALHNNSYGKFEVDHMDLFIGKELRIGTYGDPVAIPVEIWEELLELTTVHTSYTHQWRNCDIRFREFCMASVDTIAEQEEASSLGWRTFRTRRKGTPILKDEFVCPASKEGGKMTTCDKCGSCCGLSHKMGFLAKSPVIIAHGQKWIVNNFEKKTKELEKSLIKIA
jgi:hypothetical protein